jgi:hypothetical protein
MKRLDRSLGPIVAKSSHHRGREQRHPEKGEDY